MSIFATIAEQRIREAMDQGLFDDLSLCGQPIPHEDLSAVPEELRMGYKILNNSGHLPEELQLKQEILALSDLLNSCDDSDEQTRTSRKLTLRQLQLEMLMEKKGRNLALKEYQLKLEHKLNR